MKIGIVGYGRMGKAVERAAVEKGHEVVSIFDEDKLLTMGCPLNGAEVLIDFSTASVVLDVLRIASARGVSVIEGTTGWYAQLPEASLFEGISCVYSPNFSMGVFEFTRIVASASESLSALGYDVYIHEWHHSGKIDSPSGTAKRLAEIVIEKTPCKSSALEDRCDRRIRPDELHVSSTRVGRIPGTHRVGFDSESDSVLIEHSAHGRTGFVEGALKAAQWVIGRQGLYSMDEFMEAYLKGGEKE